MENITGIIIGFFFVGIALKIGEAWGELIVYIIKQTYKLHKAKKYLKTLQAQTKNTPADGER